MNTNLLICNFVASFMGKNKSICESIFEEFIPELTNPLLWVVDEENPSGEFSNNYSIFYPEVLYTKNTLNKSDFPSSLFLKEYRVRFDDLDGQMEFLVLESSDGILFLGNYVGD